MYKRPWSLVISFGLFPLTAAIHLICQFHVFRAWRTWLAKAANGIALESRAPLRYLMRKIALAPTHAAMLAAVARLQASPHYTARVQEYMDTTWLNRKKVISSNALKWKSVLGQLYSVFYWCKIGCKTFTLYLALHTSRGLLNQPS